MRAARLAATGLALVVVPGCGQAGSAHLVSAHGAAASPASDADKRAVGVYVAVLRAHLALDPAVASPTWIATRFGTTSTDVPPAVQQGITLALRPRYDVHWVAGGVDVAKRGGSFLALPAIPSSGNRIHVRLGTYCGNVCGTFAGWIVTRHGGHWSARPDGSGVAMA